MKLITLTVLICTALWANDHLVDIQNFNANYSEPRGDGFVDYLKIKNLYEFENKTEFNLEKQASKIVLSLPQEDIDIEGIPEFIHKLKNLNIKELQSLVKADSIKLEFNKFTGNTDDMYLNLSEFDLNCYNEIIGEDLLLDNCINGTSSLELENLLYKTEKETSVKNLSLKLKNRKFNVYLKTKGQNIKGNGSIQFDKDKMQIIIKVEKIKAGFISVKGMVFKELKKIESEKIEVNKPWIRIDLN